jgi:hypothetical protein
MLVVLVLMGAVGNRARLTHVCVDLGQEPLPDYNTNGQ